MNGEMKTIILDVGDVRGDIEKMLTEHEDYRTYICKECKMPCVISACDMPLFCPFTSFDEEAIAEWKEVEE